MGSWFLISNNLVLPNFYDAGRLFQPQNNPSFLGQDATDNLFLCYFLYVPCLKLPLRESRAWAKEVKTSLK